MYLNAYVPTLQVGPQVRHFLEDHLGNRLASPALISKIGNRFRAEVRAFAVQNSIPVLRLKKPDRTRWDDRKLDHVRPCFDRAEKEGRFGVVAIVAAQEFQFVYSAARRTGAGAGVYFVFSKQERRVGVYYFYVLDREFGPGFIKICTYFPVRHEAPVRREALEIEGGARPPRWAVAAAWQELSAVRSGRRR